VDEGVQVFGGNGYSREFPAERMYRDARITRIYEGTNEINRLLVPGRLLKQWPEMFTAETARKALSTQQSAAGDQAFVERAKRLAVGLLGLASSHLGADYKDAQEVQAKIADIVIEAYAIESGHARAQRMASRNDSRASLAADAASVYESDAADRIAAAAKPVVAALASRGADASLASNVQRLTAYAPTDTIAARRRIAQAVIEAGRHPF